MSVIFQSASVRPGGRRRTRGFTIIELAVVVAVLAILAAVAVPGMIGLVNSNRLAGMTGDVTASIQLARSEAIRRSAPVTVCSSANGTTCSGSAAWNQWIIIGEDNATGAIDIIRHETLTDDMQLSGPAGGIIFNSSGIARSEQTLTVCLPTDRPAENQRAIRVLISGSIITTRSNGGGACP